MNKFNELTSLGGWGRTTTHIHTLAMYGNVLPNIFEGAGL